MANDLESLVSRLERFVQDSRDLCADMEEYMEYGEASEIIGYVHSVLQDSLRPALHGVLADLRKHTSMRAVSTP